MPDTPTPEPPDIVPAAARARRAALADLEVIARAAPARAARRDRRGPARRGAGLPRGAVDRRPPARRRDRRRLRAARPGAAERDQHARARRPAATTPPCGACARRRRRVARAPRRTLLPRGRASAHAASRRAEAIAYAPRRVAAALRPAIALHPLRRRAARRPRSSQRAADAGVELLALSDHDTVAGVSEAHRTPASASACASSPPSRSPPSTTARPCRANCTSSATTSTTPARADGPPRGLPGRPRAAHAAHGRRPARGRASSSTKPRSRRASPPASRSAARTSPTPCSRAPANAERLRDGEHRRHRLADPRLPDRGPPGLPPARRPPPSREAVEAIHDAGGVAIWAHPFWDIADPDEVLASIDRFHALGIDGVEAFYVTHTREQTELLADALRRAGAAQHRLGRLPRPREPPVLALHGLRHVTASSRTSGRSPSREPHDARLSARREQRLQAVGQRLQRQLLGDVQRPASGACRRPARSPSPQRRSPRARCASCSSSARRSTA